MENHSFINNNNSAHSNNPQSENWLTSLRDVPTDWALLCVNKNKQPYDPRSGNLTYSWSDSEGMTAVEIEELEPLAVGVLLGEKSGGLLAIDFDGPGSEEKFQEVFGRSSSELPASISWTSGKEKRRQVGFVVDRELWQELKTRQFFANGKTVLEIRWSGAQSVIAGAHPETQGYYWVEGCSPADCPDPAPAPDWLLLPLLTTEAALLQQAHCNDDAARAQDMLASLDPDNFSSYWKWLKLGMALHHTDQNLRSEWVNFCRPMASFDEQECLEKWASFGANKRGNITIGSLYHWAKEAGYHPKSAPKKSPSGVLVPKGSRGEKVGKVSWLIEGFLARSATVLLASEAGSGKTSLLMRAADAVENGTPFLDQVPTNQGRVLFIQGDEPQHDSEAKMLLMDLQGSCDYWYLYCTLDLDLFEQKTKEYDLIIIDSATSILAEDGAYHEDAAFTNKLYRIQQSVADNSCSCVITTHLKKAADGIPRTSLTVEDIAGRASIRNALQDYWGIYRNSNPKWESHFSLKCFGKRNCHSGEQWELQGDDESYWWGLQDVTDGLAPKQRREIQEKIKYWFKANPAAISLKELSKSLDANQEHIRRVARSMFQQGSLHREQMHRKGMGRPNYIYSLR